MVEGCRFQIVLSEPMQFFTVSLMYVLTGNAFGLVEVNPVSAQRPTFKFKTVVTGFNGTPVCLCPLPLNCAP
jgi:hypothetical protein